MPQANKILIVADSPALPTGQAEMVRVLFEGLLEKYPEDYELCQIGLAHCFAVARPKWVVHPTKTVTAGRGEVHFAPEDLNAEATLRELLQSIRPDIVFALNDPRRLAHLCSGSAEREQKLILYLKIDGFPLPAEAGPVLNRADLIVTMSDWSRRKLLSCCPAIAPERVQFVYSPADTSRFQPLSLHERKETREALFPAWMKPEAFVLGWVGRPRWRKQVWLLYKLIHYLRSGKYLVCNDCSRVSPFDWDPVARRHLDGTKENLESRPGYLYDLCSHCGSANARQAEPLRDIFLWLHMPDDDPQAAWSLATLEHQYGVGRNEDVYYTEGCGMRSALAPEDMPTLYQLWDALIYLSGAEGFGLPAWEAMCSGVPVIYTDFSSHAEFLNAANAGLPVDGILQPERKTGFWRMIADLPEAIQAVRKLYFDRELGRALGANGRTFVHQYRVELQVEKWHQIFQSMISNSSVHSSVQPRSG